MKSLVFFSLLVLFIVFSCNPRSNNNEINPNVKHITTNDIAVDTTCFSSYQIYKETGYIWEESWVNYFNQYKGTDYNTSPKVFFSENNLLQLQAYSPNAQGVLIYYILIDTNAIYPSLAMVNTISCTPNFGIPNSSSILMSNGVDSSQKFISLQAFNTYKNNWSIRGSKEANVFTSVDGYNYSWNSIRSLLDSSTIHSGVFVKYGLRTIEPGDAADYMTVPETTMTGSVVYCNMLYGANASGVEGVALYDFAKPCPIYCN